MSKEEVYKKALKEVLTVVDRIKGLEKKGYTPNKMAQTVDYALTNMEKSLEVKLEDGEIVLKKD